MPTEDQFEAIRRAVANEVASMRRVHEMMSEREGRERSDKLLVGPSFDEDRGVERGMVALSLANARDAIRILHGEASAAGAMDEGNALEGPGDVRFFAVQPQSEWSGIAIIHGDRRFVVVQGKSDAKEKVIVAKWLPEVPARVLEGLEPIGEKDQIDLDALKRNALAFHGYAVAGSERGLGDVLTSNPWDTRIGSVEIIHDEFEGEPYTLLVGTMDDMAWFDFAAAMRPLALAHPPKTTSEPLKLMEGYYCQPLVAADGGFSGHACAFRVQAYREALLKWRLIDTAYAYGELAEDTIAAGYVWPQALLEYGDGDRLTFAVSSADGRVLGRWHENIDLICDIRSQMAVVTRNQAGDPERIEFFPTYEPFETALDAGWDVNELVTETARCLHIYADDKAEPPRLTRAQLARRIADGEPLPLPAGGIDLVTGELLPGSTLNREQVVANALYALKSDLWALDAIAKGEVPGYTQEKKPFDQPGEQEMEATPAI